MRLRVPASDFATTCTRHQAVHVYAHSAGGRTVFSGITPMGLSIWAWETGMGETVRADCLSAGLKVDTGELLEPGEREAIPPYWVAAVAYSSATDIPGLWVDSSIIQPSTAEVTERLFKELEQDGELRGLTYEEFLRIAKPNVVVVSPEEVARYADPGSSK